MRIAILGSSGQLGYDLLQAIAARPADHAALPFSGRAQLDITNPAAITAMLDAQKPDAIINTAAFHNVDLCESEPEAAYRTNTLAIRHLAEACEHRQITLLQIGTDYVMEGAPSSCSLLLASGFSPSPLPESAPVHPQSIYALTRFGGDRMTLTHAPTRGYVIRSCGLFGVAGCKLKGGLNFVDTMIQVARQKKPLAVVHDQIVAPTPTDDLARQLLTILDHLPRLAPGIYHAVSHGQCSWFEFARTALELANLPHTPPHLTPTTSRERPTPAKRPCYSVLDNAKLRALNLDVMTDWQSSLARYIQTKYAP